MKYTALALMIASLTLLVGCAAPTPDTPAPPVSDPALAPMETQPPAAPTEAAAQPQPVQPAATEPLASQPNPAPATCDLTPADGEGPYYLAGAPIQDGFISLVTPDLGGDRLTLTGAVYLQGCQTVLGGAVFEIWHVDAQGAYDLSGYTFRGGVKTGADGVFTIETIVPPVYEGRPQHIHYKVHVEGMPTFTSQIYFVSDPRAAGFPPAMLIAPAEKDGVLTAVFNIVLAQ